MGGGAWPFLVGGVICLVNSDNERDLSLLNSVFKLLYGWSGVHHHCCGRKVAVGGDSVVDPWMLGHIFLKGHLAFSQGKWGNNRSVMPLDVLGRTRATLMRATSFFLVRKDWGILQIASCRGSIIVIISRKQGIPSKRKSSACADYVPALCTHRPSLLPIEWSGEPLGLSRSACGATRKPLGEKLGKPYHLEEVRSSCKYRVWWWLWMNAVQALDTC